MSLKWLVQGHERKKQTHQPQKVEAMVLKWVVTKDQKHIMTVLYIFKMMKSEI